MAMSTEVPQEGPRLPLNTFVYVGIVQLVGWNAVLTSSGFLDHDVFSGKQWAFLAAITYSFGITFGQALMIRGPLPRLAFSVRWILSVSLLSIAPLGLLCMVALTEKGALDVGVSFGVALACVIMLSLGAAIFQASTFGLAGAADPRLSGRLMMGQGFGGIITAVASIAKPGMATFTWLILGTALLTAAGLLVYFAKLHNHPYIRPLLEDMATDRLRPPTVTSDASGVFAQTNAVVMPTMSCANPLPMPSPRRRGRFIAADVGPQAAGVLFVFAVTFTVFPGVVNRWSGAFGLPSTHFVTLLVGEFQLLDVVGRTLGGFVRKPRGKAVLAASLARVVFVPLFLGTQRLQDSFLNSGGWKVLAMALFAFSNGFVSTLGMMLGPERVLVQEEKETAGHIMSFCLVSGIFIGSLLGLLTQLW